eukprot:Skav231598  [mRNA]  locus=scaffold232:352365:353491:+ [translate_table: standard]
MITAGSSTAWWDRFVHRPSHELAVVDPDGEDDNNLTGKVDVARALGATRLGELRRTGAVNNFSLIVVLDYELFDPGLIGKGAAVSETQVSAAGVSPADASTGCPCPSEPREEEALHF